MLTRANAAHHAVAKIEEADALVMPTPTKARLIVVPVVEQEMSRLSLHGPCLAAVGSVAAVGEDE